MTAAKTTSPPCAVGSTRARPRPRRSRGGADVGRADELDAADRAAAVRELGTPARLTEATDRFSATPDVVSWACSSCSFTHGLDGARDQARTLTALFVAFLAEAGVTTVHAVSADHEDADAVLVAGTALRTTPLLAGLDERLGKAVLTATAVAVADATAATPAQSSPGTLFSAGPCPRPPSSSSS
ncbi:hypothetical protein [Amycolatopsis sp. DG1A-15b]|uniref:hypothetical protein n=1 Tax=Amycolatopsis sp. DG1A-15b TaxID=3052846 RepID=UPI00255BD433|nr:hypothetical protein [Amycolatopsis sp. DG1A-15b]WIX84877.1 hypothetical protein QRY02_26945 [Amycolatopsis sp. DG1A-15b]